MIFKKNTFNSHTLKGNEAELIQKENLGGNLPEQTAPSAGDIQKKVEIEKLLRSDTLVYGYREMVTGVNIDPDLGF